MSLWSTARTIATALGVTDRDLEPIGCALGRTVFRETKRATQIVNVRRPRRRLTPAAVAVLAPWFPELDLSSVRIRTSCRLPPNRFHTEGRIYAMTFGSTIYWRDEFDDDDPKELVRLAHELVHVDQVRRLGGESAFACAYGEGYIEGGGELPAYLDDVGAYERNPLEAEAYSFEARFRDDRGRVVEARLRTTPADAGRATAAPHPQGPR
ncbi:MAG: DUF4157 domain-containing protein [Ilumatobacter sp.]|nr:DUF4157 domain-containing protein [Ilumatobacter sp.]